MNLKNFLKAISAGFCIAIAGASFLSVDSSVLGSLLFALGLLTIYVFEFNLYTGKSCYVIDNPKKYLPIALNAFLGNLVGTYIFAFLLRGTGLDIMVAAQEALSHKLAHSYIDMFILSIFCGICMSIAVLGFAKQQDGAGRAVIIILPVMTFILCHFDHSIANMFYISAAKSWNLNTVIFTIIAGTGNMVGCNVFPLMIKLIGKDEDHH